MSNERTALDKPYAGRQVDKYERGFVYSVPTLPLFNNLVRAGSSLKRRSLVVFLRKWSFDEGASSFIGVLSPPAHTGANSLDVCDKLSGVRL